MSRKHHRAVGWPRRTDRQRVPDQRETVRELLADALRARRAGRVHDAERYYRGALEIDPNQPDALVGFGALLMAVHNFEGALVLLARALSLRETDALKAMFVGCLERARQIPSAPALRDLVIRAMSEPWARPAAVAYAAVDLIKADAAVREGIGRVRAAWPRRLTEDDLFGAAGAAAIAGDRLLRVALATAPVCDVELER